MVRRQELPAIKIGGRGQWRVSREHLEAYIAEQYDLTRAWVIAHPFIGDAGDGEPHPRSSDDQKPPPPGEG